MTGMLLALYLKLNLLLVITAALWLTTKTFGLLQLAVLDARQQLALARGLLTGALLLTLAPLLVDLLQPGWLARWSSNMSGGYGGTFTVVAGTTSLWSRLPVKGGFNMRELLGAVILAGIAWQSIKLGWRWWQLRCLINAATPWKHIAGVHILLSSDTGTPFTTRALGVRHVVLPLSMLDNLPYLKLALKHELQHLRQHDLEWLLVLELTNVICWWNPLVHFWHAEYDRLHELACDEALVLERRVDSHSYGNCLLEVANAAAVPVTVAASTMVPKPHWFGTHHSQLRRRIMKLVSMKKDRHRTLKAALYGVLLGSGLLGGTLVVLAAETPASQQRTNRDVIPLVRVNPQYPAKALAEHLQGWVTIRFDLSEVGAVENPVVVDSCAGETFADCIRNQPVFAEVALDAIRKWQYEPRIVNGVAVRREGVETMLRFQLQD